MLPMPPLPLPPMLSPRVQPTPWPMEEPEPEPESTKAVASTKAAEVVTTAAELVTTAVPDAAAVAAVGDVKATAAALAAAAADNADSTAWHARLSLCERLPALGPPRGLGPLLAGGKPRRCLSAAASFCRLLTSDCSVRGFIARGGGSNAESHIIFVFAAVPGAAAAAADDGDAAAAAAKMAAAAADRAARTALRDLFLLILRADFFGNSSAGRPLPGAGVPFFLAHAAASRCRRFFSAAVDGRGAVATMLNSRFAIDIPVL